MNATKTRRISSLPALRILVAAAGGLQVLAARNAMNVDGMSYIDVARSYANGDLAGAINGYWSPLYSWLIAAVLLVFNPSAQHEFAAVHSLNFLLFLFALGAFDFFLRELFITLKSGDAAERERKPPAWWVLGYSLFAYASLVLINLGHVGPDILVCACMYLGAGILLRVSRDREVPFARAAALGATIAAGYLTKAAMLPVSLVVLATAAILVARERRSLAGLAVTAAVFAVVAGSWTLALSQAKGRFTFGDAAKLNYAWHVDNVREFRHWQGDSLHGTPLHASRPLSTGPVIYEFAEPVRGTYPIWYDASYWYDGVRGRLEPGLELHRLATSVDDYMGQGWFYPSMVGLIVLYFSVGNPGFRQALRSTWFLLVPVAVGLSVYAMALVLGRYVAPFVVVGLLTLLGGMGARTTRNRDDGGGVGDRTAVALAAVFALMVIGQLWFNDRKVPGGQVHLAVATRLAELGVPPASRVGVIGESSNAYWAHLAGDRIVAEITPEESDWFWAQTADQRTRQLRLFNLPRAVAVIADHVPAWADTSGWVPVGAGGYWLARLAPTRVTGR